MRYTPEDYLTTNEPEEEICVIDEFQRKGTTFPINIVTQVNKVQHFALMDTGALRSCINYNTFAKLAKTTLRSKWVPKVVGADGSDLGSMGTVQLTLVLGDRTVQQEFIVCRQLKRNVILGVDFARRNCAGVNWTTQRT